MSKKNYAVAMKVREEYEHDLPWYARAALWMQKWYWVDENDKAAVALSDAKRFTKEDARRKAGSLERKRREIETVYVDVEGIPLHVKAALFLTGRY